MTVEEASGPPVEVWPDCMESVECFIDMSTQWDRAGMAGTPCGLKYTALPVVLGVRGIPKKQWSGLFDDIRVMEMAALEVMNKK